ncbi:MAG: elongation factor Ts [Deltaproteobacteria bacterium]|nr:elongation factor Ts [Deltaproteobacteria bacterium]MBI3388621.1 elongation factor Ts [Deltaproteobacteria bacterium]
MSEVSAALVRELRDKTGAGMMDCKRALADSAGDLEKAIVVLREKGLAAAAKRATRVASEGLIVAASNGDGTVGALVEVNCETDFVARTPEFGALVEQAAQQVLTHGADVNLGELITTAVAKTGENVVMRRAARFESPANGGLVGSYIHAGGKIGVLLELARDGAITNSADCAQLVRDLAMQVAAANPRYVRREEVAVDVLDGERAIYRAQAATSGKPDAVIEKMVTGKLDKFFRDVCLLEQPFIKDPDRSVSTWLAEVVKRVGGSITVKRFARYQLGEQTEQAA